MRDLDRKKRIAAPTLSPTILHRETLVKKLETALSADSPATHYKLVVLSTPAGYGKTTLLADFALHSSFPCCWYFLDQHDVEKATFLTTLILSIRSRFPHFGKRFDPLLSSSLTLEGIASTQYYLDAVPDTLVEAIASEIPERFVIFLCNYQEVNGSQEINELVNYLLQKLPDQCAMVIESRAVPALDFAWLLANDKIIGFDHTFLHFTPAELQALARQQNIPPLSEQEAERLITLFGGWTVGILLGTRLGDKRLLHVHRDLFIPANLPKIQIDRQNLFAYLVNEVFSRDLALYTFLKNVAVLQEMPPTICDALLGSNNAAEYLLRLEQQGFFVTHRDEGTQLVYTCHAILRELLCDACRRQEPERWLALQQKAMEVWLEVGEIEQAIYHALEGRLDEEASRLIVTAHEHFIGLGRAELLSHWIDQLLSRLPTPSPALLLIRANIYLARGTYLQALPLLRMASETLAKFATETETASLIEAQIFIARSKALFQMREYTQAQELCLQVIQRVPASEFELHAEAQMRLGVCATLLGNLASGVAHMQKALQLRGRNSDRRQTADLHGALAHIYCLQGNFELAEHHLARTTKCWERLQDEYGKIGNLLLTGMVKHYQGDFAVAEIAFQQGLAQARGAISFQRLEAYALENLGGLYIDMADYKQALSCLEDGLALARQMNDRYLVNGTLCSLAEAYLLMEDAETALLLITEVNQEIAERDSAYERARYELTYGTILLSLHKYEEAYASLSELETRLSTIGLRYELLKTKLCLTECLFAQGQTSDAFYQVNNLGKLLTGQAYERLVRREIQFLPFLKRAIETMPELEGFQALFQTEKETVSGEKTGQSTPPANYSSLPTVKPVNTPTHSLKILALGEVAVFIDKKLVTRWRITRAMELLFFLLDRSQPLRKEQIIAALWPEAEDSINQTFHSTIYYLRKVLGESCIASDAGTYWLDLNSYYKEIWYDVTHFQQHHAQAKAALSQGDDQLAHTELLSMIELYRGDYVQSFYNDWSTFQRDRLRQAYLDARQQAGLIAWRNEQLDESIAHWQYMLTVDNCLEEAHYWLIRCYLRQGKRGLALRQYQRCVELLRKELATEPGPAMQSLRQQLIKRSTDKNK